MKTLSVLGCVQLVFKSIVSSWIDVSLAGDLYIFPELFLPSKRNYCGLDHVRRCWFADFFSRSFST